MTSSSSFLGGSESTNITKRKFYNVGLNETVSLSRETHIQIILKTKNQSHHRHRSALIHENSVQISVYHSRTTRHPE